MSKESFDKDLYKGYKEIADNTLNNVPWCYKGSFKGWAMHQLPLIKVLADKDDFEACKAIKDAFTEYVNKHIQNEEDKLSFDAIIKEEFIGYD